MAKAKLGFMIFIRYLNNFRAFNSQFGLWELF